MLVLVVLGFYIFSHGYSKFRPRSYKELTLLWFETKDPGNTYSLEIWTEDEAIATVLRTWRITLVYEWLSNLRTSVFSTFR